MRKITASRVFLDDGKLHSDKVVVVDEHGVIGAVLDAAEADPASVEILEGVLVPGFINAHCHLELSHMKGRVDTGTGLIPFITNVVKTRAAAREEIMEAITAAEQEMYDSGIVAVGDISNQLDTLPTKSTGRIRYYTFVECFDLLQEENAMATFEQYSAVYDQVSMDHGCAKSFVPHAPYSVSDDLYRLIRKANPDDCTVTIHNQETPPENEFFISKTGGFIDFYNAFGLPLEGFEATGRPSVYSALPQLNPANRNIFVHNTLTTAEDIAACHAFSDRVYWATCPNANLYIENRLPDYSLFLAAGACMTIGTDSLTSNWQLDLLEEMKTISKYQSYVPLETLLTWATKNGAQALGFDDELGTIEPGKQPGLVLIEGVEKGRLGAAARSRRIV
jgi:cytosine/adenosine deaminase-related metal-dependent hydrolase